MVREFFEERGLDGDPILTHLLVKHASYKKVAKALEEQYGLSIMPTTVRYHAKRLNLELRFVYKRWYENHSQEMIASHRRDLHSED